MQEKKERETNYSFEMNVRLVFLVLVCTITTIKDYKNCI